MDRTTKGTFAKGHKGYKPKGSKHHSTQIRGKLEEILSRELDNLPELLERIEKPEARAKLIIDLLPYKLPKLQNVEYSEVLERQIEQLSDEDLDRLLDELSNRMNDGNTEG